MAKSKETERKSDADAKPKSAAKATEKPQEKKRGQYDLGDGSRGQNPYN